MEILPIGSGVKTGKGFSQCVTQTVSDAHSQVRINLCLIFIHSLRKVKANSLDSASMRSWPR